MERVVNKGVLCLIIAFASFLFSASVERLTINICSKYKKFDPVTDRSVHSGDVSRFGGIGIFVSFGFFCILSSLYFNSFSLNLLPFFIGGAFIWLGGVIDDFTNLHARYKFLFQIIIVFLSVSFSPFYIDNFFGLTIPVILGKFITFCWVMVLVNAFNLIDGIDLLCSSLVLISITVVTIICYLKGTIFLSGIILCSSLLGFMMFNKPKAKIFLGDSGSQTLGYCVAVFPLICKYPSVKNNEMLIMLILASIPVEDVIAAVWRRLRDKRSVFSSDRAHIHHKLMNIGFSSGQTCFYITLIHLINCAIIVISVFMGKYASIAVLGGAVIITQVVFISIHFINRAVNRKLKGLLPENPQEEH